MAEAEVNVTGNGMAEAEVTGEQGMAWQRQR